MWVSVGRIVNNIAAGADRFVLRSDTTPNVFVPTGNSEHPYKFINPPKLVKRGVDRKATAALRKRIKPFIDYAETILKLSDGWVTNDSVQAAREACPEYMYRDADEFVLLMENGDTNLWTRALYDEICSCQPAEFGYSQYKYNLDAFRRRVNNLLAMHPGAVTTIPVPTDEYGAVEGF